MFLVPLNKQKAILDQHEANIAGHGSQIARLTSEEAMLWEEVERLQRTVALQTSSLKNLEGHFAAVEEAYMVAQDKTQGSNSESEDESDDEEERHKQILEMKQATMEASGEAYSDPSLKELTHQVYQFKMGIGKLTAISLPWYPENPDKSTWPHIIGTDEAVLCFHWDEPVNQEDNWYSMRMIVGYMQSRSDTVVPGATAVLLANSAEDLQRCATENKELINLYKAVDAAKDPTPYACYIAQVKGPLHDKPLKIAKKWENKVRHWMVEPDWVVKAENKQYNMETCIIDSGKAWGDDEDPEERAKRQAMVKGLKKEVKESKKWKVLEKTLKLGVAKKAKKDKKGKGRKNKKIAVGCSVMQGLGDDQSG
ncbi:hypothetical protein DXG01_015967 [Tephrocybe rancida]|nr:hypothetical protein DXG01_015967 [Tephrocybe rancida]